MKASYAITWQEGSGPVRSGKLELRPRGLVLEGSNGSSARSREIAYDELTSVQVARAPGDRLCGRPTLVVDSRSFGSLRIAGVSQPGIISELAESLMALHVGEKRPASRLVIILPLKEGSRDRARAMLQQGPPFDPQAADLDRHHVFLTDDEVIFVFETATADAVERLASDTSLWAAAAGWNELVAAPPRLAEDVYSWVRPSPREELSFGPTPGPGDSDGGDVYAP